MTSDLVFGSVISVVFMSVMVVNMADLAPDTVMRTSDYFEVHGIDARRVDDTAHLRVNREIHEPIEMSYNVRIMEYVAGGWIERCIAEGGPLEYRPEASLPEIVTLDWWTNGKCSTLPDGDTQIWTTWTPWSAAGPHLAPVSVVVDVKGEGK